MKAEEQKLKTYRDEFNGRWLQSRPDIRNNYVIKKALLRKSIRIILRLNHQLLKMKGKQTETLKLGNLKPVDWKLHFVQDDWGKTISRCSVTSKISYSGVPLSNATASKNTFNEEKKDLRIKWLIMFPCPFISFPPPTAAVNVSKMMLSTKQAKWKKGNQASFKQVYNTV